MDLYYACVPFAIGLALSLAAYLSDGATDIFEPMSSRSRKLYYASAFAFLIASPCFALAAWPVGYAGLRNTLVVLSVIGGIYMLFTAIVVPILDRRNARLSRGFAESTGADENATD